MDQAIYYHMTLYNDYYYLSTDIAVPYKMVFKNNNTNTNNNNSKEQAVAEENITIHHDDEQH
jgi:hypothetical protein